MITTGTILIERGTVLPDGGLPPGAPFSAHWTLLPSDRTSIEGWLEKAGWTWFYMAGEIHTGAFGFDKEKRVQSAVMRAVRQVGSEHCNCIEITDVGARSFLGMRYSTITAHARHIQKSCTFR
jgi:hypothetical protein